MAVPSVYQLPLFILEKRCTQCGQVKPLPSFRADPRAAGGHRHQCRDCCKANRRAWHQAHRQSENAKTRAWRVAHPEYHAAWNLRQRIAHPEKVKAQTQASKLRRADAIRAWRQRQYKATAEEQKAKTRAYTAAHREECRLKARRAYHADVDKARQIARLHRLRKPENVRAAAWRSRAKRRQAEGHFAPHDIKTLEQAQAGLCYYCQEPYGRYHVDHKQPLSRGGTNWPDNLCLTCPPCNLSKHDKTEQEYRLWRN